MTDEPSLRRGWRTADVSDAELVEATRRGDRSAFATLWGRHADAAHRVARAVSWSSEPEDLVSEAFTRILRATTAGGGPTEAFRPYLFTTIRNIAATWAKDHRTVSIDTLDDSADESIPDPGALIADRTSLSRAFATLPERWRTVLWYLEVEGLTPREMAPMLGMKANAVAALSYRAREGFRKAWLEQHVDDAELPSECRWATGELGRAEGEPMPRSARRRLDEHLEHCGSCRVIAGVGADARQNLRAVLLVGVLGGAAAATYAQLHPLPASAAAAVTPGVGPGVLTAVGGVVVVAAAAAAIVWGTALLGPGADVTDPIAGDDTTGLVPATVVPVATASPTVAVTPPATTPTPVPTPDPAPSDDASEPVDPTYPVVPAPSADPAPTSRPDPDPTAAPTPSVTPSPTPVVSPSPAPVPTSTPSVTPQSTPSASPTPSPSPTPGPVAEVALDPVDTAATIPAPLTGRGEPGATVTAISSSGAPVGEAVVGDDGSWVIRLDVDLLDRTSTVSVVQSVDGTQHSESGPVGPYALPVPDVSGADGRTIARTDEDGDGVADDVAVLVSGESGRSVTIAVDGVSTGRLHLLTGEPLRRYIPDIALGEHTLGVRYVDPESGLQGWLGTVDIVVTAGATGS